MSDNVLSASLRDHELRSESSPIGFDPTARLRAERVEFRRLRIGFDRADDARRRGEIELQVPGAMNVQNALAAIAVGCALQLPFEEWREVCARFCGVRRRFDILAPSDRVTMVDDYAHHPTAVRATMRPRAAITPVRSS